MQKLIIKKVGPISNVEATLNRFNFFIGPQSSGKSTIAKILSTCRWIEKEIATTGKSDLFNAEEEFLPLFVSFHKMQGYFGDDSEIHYTSDIVAIDYKNHIPSCKLKNRDGYSRKKICYIPAERNAVTLPELQGVELGQTNLRSFLFDWFNAREYYVEANKSDILNLGVKYFFNPNEKNLKDQIQHINGQTYQIPLSHASSGMQSVIPLQIMLQYYTDQYFRTFEERLSFEMDAKYRKIQRDLVDDMVLKVVFPDFDPNNRKPFIDKANNRLHQGDPTLARLSRAFREAFGRLTIPINTSFIIEEPEQNLYPDTQTDLLDFMVSACSGTKKHDLTVTTHSPYLLNQLNLMFKRHDEKDGNAVGLDFDAVSVYAIQEGQLVDLKLGNAHLINPQFLSEPLDRIYNQYEAYGKH